LLDLANVSSKNSALMAERNKLEAERNRAGNEKLGFIFGDKDSRKKQIKTQNAVRALASSKSPEETRAVV